MAHTGADGEVVDVGTRRYTMFLLVLVYTSSFIDRSIINILIPPIKEAFQVSDTAMGLLTGLAFAVFYATLGLPVALLADRSNRRNIIAWAVAIWSGMTALCGAAQNYWQLAAARVGVGIGEAGAGPPAHSMIADLYPVHERTSAMAIYSWGIHLGLMFGALAGGWIAQFFGWRAAFLVVGLPGLLLALLVRFTMTEPARGLTGAPGHAPAKQDIMAAFRHMWQTPTLRHTVIGCTLVAVVGYGVSSWGAAFLVRSHGLSLGEVGTYTGLIGGSMGILGAITAGKIADRLSVTDPRWTPWIVALCKVIALPLVFLFYLPDTLWIALIAFVPMIALAATYQGSTFAMVQTLSPAGMRAQASAILLFIINLIGLGLGPTAVGALSDALMPYYGQDSLRYALLIVSVLGLWGAWHYYLAGRYYREDLEISQGKVMA
ncbi:MFS transporter [Iodidimonas sp. SYSU 1G8]|uniref:spinster family MFS transporter n=1 Tax=Iodidimonas sp. SYSU 1G8 TaxID=3133967 RepID=UPI0031FE74CE